MDLAVFPREFEFNMSSSVSDVVDMGRVGGLGSASPSPVCYPFILTILFSTNSDFQTVACHSRNIRPLNVLDCRIEVSEDGSPDRLGCFEIWLLLTNMTDACIHSSVLTRVDCRAMASPGASTRAERRLRAASTPPQACSESHPRHVSVSSRVASN